MFSKYAVENRVVVGFCVVLIVLGGIWSYLAMGRLEDPEFTIKTAVVATLYPGATAEEVDTRVAEVVGRHIRRVSGVDEIRAQSRPGVSIIYVDMRNDFPPDKLKQAWQDLRNKMSELKTELPVEALTPRVIDDFGDVFGIILALSGDGFSDAELRDRAKDLQRELLCVDQVGRVELWGIRQECIEVTISRARMAELSIHPAMIFLALAQQNLQTDAGQMTVDGENIRFAPGGTFETIEEIGDLIIPNGSVDQVGDALASAASGGPRSGLAAMLSPSGSVGGNPIRLRDIATITRTYEDPPGTIMRSNGKSAVAVAIAPISGGDVIKMGESVHRRAREVLATFPAGYQLEQVCYQPDNVVRSIEVFEGNLREAIIIVTVVVMIAMGWRSGLLITGSLLVVILATLCILHPLGVVLQRTSLGSLIVALGILVDDAVVVGDMILVNMQRGMPRKEACVEGAKHVGHELLGATIVGALAFFPVFLSPDMTGEYCRDLFIVVGSALMISWFVAMMQTPVVYYQFVHVKLPEAGDKPSKDPHSGPVFMAYRRLLEWVLHHKTITFGVLLAVLAAAGYGFTHVGQIFFPPAQRAQFYIEYWRNEGTSIHAVSDDLAEMETYLMAQDGVMQVSTFVGSGPPRFYLPYEPEGPSDCYGTILVNVEKIRDVDKLLVPVEQELKDRFPQGLLRARRFTLGPSTPCDIEVRFRGPDHDVLRDLAEQAKEIFHAQAKAKDVNDDWRERIPVWTPTYSQTKGVRTMISRSDMNIALRWATLGIPASVFLENDNLLPIRVRGTPGERNNMADIHNIPVWGFSLHSVPLAHVISEGRIEWQPSQIRRRDGVPTITVGCNPHDDVPWNRLFAVVRPEIEKIDIPDGYELIWGGQYKQSIDAESTLLGKLPIAVCMMAIIVVALFNSLRQPLIILLSFPLMLIGITVGLLVTGLPFGFMALVGAMSLLGMSVRNGVVLMGQIDTELSKGESPYQAVVTASVERMRPVTVAAMTVVVGMIPLLRDPLFNSMAAAIMFGLIFATALTLLVVPALYTILFRIKPE